MTRTSKALATTFLLLGIAACAAQENWRVGPPDEGPPLVVPSSQPPVADDAATGGSCPSSACPEGRTSCPNNPFPCGVDLRFDNDNCGECGHHCPRDYTINERFHAVTQCVDGECRLACSSAFGDCNGMPEDGCEIQLSSTTYGDKNNCGGCGILCPDVCYNNTCGCPAGESFCTASGRCHDLRSENGNCGECGNVCPPSAHPPPPPSWNATYSCFNKVCDQLICIGRYADCDEDLGDPDGNGCEVDLDRADPNNCGGCGIVCAPGKVCKRLPSGPECVCECGSDCFDVDSDFDNCGACGFECPGDRRSLSGVVGAEPDPAHGRPVCSQGRCDYRCSPNWGDCDGDIANGCETNFLDDSLNCGGCGIRCEGVEDQPCVKGKCATRDCEIVR
jgi:hypothetical protein